MNIYCKFFFTLILSTTLLGMEDLQYFSSNQQIKDYTEYLNLLTTNLSPNIKNIHDIIKIAENNPPMQLPDGVAIDQEIRTLYLATRVNVLKNLYCNLVEKEGNNRRHYYDKTVNLIEESITEINSYLPKSYNAPHSIKIRAIQGKLHYLLGGLHSEMITHLTLGDESKALVPKIIDIFKKALKILPTTLDDYLEDIALTKFDLIAVYCYEPKAANFAQARNLLNQIKDFPHLFEVANEIIDTNEKNLYKMQIRGPRHNRLKRKAKNKIGGGDNAYKLLAAKRLEHLERLDRLKNKIEFEDIDAKFSIYHAELHVLLKSKHSHPAQICQVARNIEKIISDHFNFSLENDLEKIYGKYKFMLPDESGSMFAHEMLTYINAFKLSGDKDTAKQLTDILVALSPNDNSLSSRIIRAGVEIHNNNNMEPWLELEKELATKNRNKNKQKKSNHKKLKKQDVLAKIKLAQERGTDQIKAVRESPIAKTFKPRAHEDDSKKYFEPHDPYYKAQKLQRHEDALADKNRRIIQQETDKAADFLIAHEEKSIEANTQDIPNFYSNLKISDYYELKGLPSDVDNEIENASWKFSRNDLKAYFKALGCENKSGKGSHEKSLLPKSVHVMHKTELITILVESGGALTLPEWEDYVPFYLRKQILLARKKLIKIATEIIKFNRSLVEIEKGAEAPKVSKYDE